MIERFFNENGWLYRFLNRLWDLLVLEFLFLLTSIPLITIGASVCALYTVTLKAVKCEDSYIARSYLAAWKEKLKRATWMWLIYGAAGVVLGIDIFILGRSGEMGKLLVFAGGFCAVVWLLIGLYLFPLQARFENSAANTAWNSLVIAVKFLPSTLQILGIFLAVPLMGVVLGICIPSAFSWYCSLAFFVGFSGTAYAASFIYRKVFDALEEAQPGRIGQNIQ